MFAKAKDIPAAQDEAASGKLPAAYSLGFAVQHVLPFPSALNCSSESPSIQHGANGAIPSVWKIWRPDRI